MSWCLQISDQAGPGEDEAVQQFNFASDFKRSYNRSPSQLSIKGDFQCGCGDREPGPTCLPGWGWGPYFPSPRTPAPSPLSPRPALSRAAEAAGGTAHHRRHAASTLYVHPMLLEALPWCQPPAVDSMTESSGEESILKLIQVFARIQFLVVVGLRSLLPA